MKTRKIHSWLVAALLLAGSLSAWAAPWLQVNGTSGEYATFHYYIDESEGETDQIQVEFWPNEAQVEKVELWSNLNNRDFATLYPADPNTVNPGDEGYWTAHTMTHGGNGRYWINMPVEKCGAYRLTARYKVSGDPNWRWYQGRNTAVVISDTSVRDMIMMEVQVNVVDAVGDDYNSRSTFADLHDDWRFNLDYVNELGVNTLWLMPFHPIGSKSDGNHGEVGSPYSIKNMWKVAEHLGRDGTREGAMNEFKAFVAEAEAKGVNILFDTIFNHTAKDAEMERNPDNPYELHSDPPAQIRYLRPSWYSKYTGNGYCNWTQDPGGSPPYEYWAPADDANQVGPAPADRHDFGKWCDAIDLFWGNYSALGSPANEDDGMWGASAEVKKMTEYFTYFAEYWLDQTDGAIDGFRCDFAQGLPPQAWEYIINRAKSKKPEFMFMAESLDGGAVSRRAARHFDVVNENWVWSVLENGGSAAALRSVIDERKANYGYAGVLRGLVNHDQNAPADKWFTLAHYAVGAAVDGSPQMFMGQELGYRDAYGFSRFRTEYGRSIPDIRNYYNMQALWNDMSPDHDALWNRYAEINHGRQRSAAIRLANQYYIDMKGGGIHDKIFSVLKYESFGWDAADQDVVLCFVNLEPWIGHSGNFEVNVPAIYLDPNKRYNVRNLSSSDPDSYVWPEARTGSDIVQNGFFVSFPGNGYASGAVAQFMKLEEQGVVEQLWVGNTYNWPFSGDVDAGEDLWINAETWPIADGQTVTIAYRTEAGGDWSRVDASWDFNSANNSHWHVNLGSFPSGTVIEYYVEATKGRVSALDNHNGDNYRVTVNGLDPVQWIGGTYHWPFDGEIDPGEDLWINTETWPAGSASETYIVYSVNGGDWHSAQIDYGMQIGNNDWWHINLGSFQSGDRIRYAVTAYDPAGNNLWDSNGGADYEAVVK